MKEALIAITDNTALEKERATLQEECEVFMELMRKMVQENARSAQDQADYKVKYGSMSARYEKASTRLAEVSKDIAACNAKRSKLEGFLKLMDGREKLLTVFDESLWLGIVDKLNVQSDSRLVFVMKDGSTVIWIT